MAQFQNMFKVDLSAGAAPVVPLAQIYYADVEANRVGAVVLLNGEAFPLSGTCSGTAILSDGSTVALTGAIDGNRAYVDLPAGCYSVAGTIQVFVKLTTGGVTTTLICAVGTVRLTETGTVIDPGTIIPSVSALIDDIDAAVASIPADYSALLATIAPAYADLTFPVSAGQWCWYSGTLYAANQDIATSESWTAAHWRAIVIGGEFASLKSALSKLTDIPGDNIVAITDFTNATSSVTNVKDTTNGTITITNGSSSSYACVQTADTFILSNLIIGRTYRLHAKARKISGSPNMRITIRGTNGNADGIAKNVDLNSGEGFADFIADQYMKRVTLFVAYGSSTKNSVSEFSDIWLKEYDTTGIDDNARDNIVIINNNLNQIDKLLASMMTPGRFARAWVRGSINGTTGELIDSLTRIRTFSYISVETFLEVKFPSNLKISWRKYTTDNEPVYVNGSGWLTESFVLPGGYKYKLVAAYSNEASILGPAGKNVELYMYHPGVNNQSAESWGLANAIESAKQVCEIKWTPKGNIPRNRNTNDVYPNPVSFFAQTEQTGLPYSSVRDQDKAIGMDVSIHTFMTAVNDPNSVLYTRRSTVSNSAAYYGTVCSGLINYAMGYRLDLTNYYLAESEMFETVPMQSIVPGDMIWVDGHCAFVKEATRDSYGRIVSVIIQEEWKPLPRETVYATWSAFIAAREGYIARRFKMLDGVPYTAIPYIQCFDENESEIKYPDIQTEFGDAAVFMAGENVKVNIINARSYSSITIKKDGETVQTVSTIATFTIENVQSGLYTIEASDGTYETASTFFVVDASASFDDTTGIVTFSSTNATPVLVNVYNLPSNRLITCKPIILTDADRNAGQIDVSEYMDSAYKYAKVTFQTQYGTAVWYSETHEKWVPITE